MKKRSHRLERMARVYDDEILPVWSRRFGRMLMRGLTLPSKAMVLDVGCGTGYPALEILERMEDGRIIAIESIGALLDVARKKAGDLSGKRIFFRTEATSAKLAFADEVYDLVVSNVALGGRDDSPTVLSELSRVCKIGGRVIVTLPLQGSYAEFYDIYREVLTKTDRHPVLEKLEQHIARTPTPEQAIEWMKAAGLRQVSLEVEEFKLLFKSSREFFFAPVIEYGPLSAWKEIAGKGQQMQDTFWQIKEAIDAYFHDRAFDLTITAGCLRGVKPDPEGDDDDEDSVPDEEPTAPGTPPEIAVPVTAPLSDRFELEEEDTDEGDDEDDEGPTGEM